MALIGILCGGLETLVLGEFGQADRALPGQRADNRSVGVVFGKATP
jgi:hypothetical protein